MLRTVPYADIDTVFLDVGNTLISVDFDWVAAELGRRGVVTDAESLRRAEAAARPAFSHRLFVDGVPAGTDLFRAYLVALIEPLPRVRHLSPAEFDSLITELRRVLRPDGRASVLWRSVMPGVPEALVRLQALGLRLVVVSNSTAPWSKAWSMPACGPTWRTSWIRPWPATTSLTPASFSTR